MPFVNIARQRQSICFHICFIGPRSERWPFHGITWFFSCADKSYHYEMELHFLEKELYFYQILHSNKYAVIHFTHIWITAFSIRFLHVEQIKAWTGGLHQNVWISEVLKEISSWIFGKYPKCHFDPYLSIIASQNWHQWKHVFSCCLFGLFLYALKNMIQVIAEDPIFVAYFAMCTRAICIYPEKDYSKFSRLSNISEPSSQILYLQVINIYPGLTSNHQYLHFILKWWCWVVMHIFKSLLNIF